MPAVGELVHLPAVQTLIEKYGRSVVTYAIRRALDEKRSQMMHQETPASFSGEELIERSVSHIERIMKPGLKPVINATGIILHTNLGRALLGRKMLADIEPVICNYSNLEFDLETGQRGDRNTHLSELLRFLTGAEDSIVVNNNAAALVLTLSTLAKRREVIISRGELIEIGGSFRLPEIMRTSGAKMIEVGTTNRTRPSDYENAITPRTAMILKAHTSNYALQGFTEDVSVKELAGLAARHNLPLLYDIGSGLLCKPQGLSLAKEPDIHSALADGADLVCFSCDKLLGGPQAGVIAGRTELIRKLAKAPLMRALRVGKLTLAALESACRNYLSKDRLLQNNPTFSMLERSPRELTRLADQLAQRMTQAGLDVSVVDSPGQSGGGTLPDVSLPGKAVALVFPKKQRARLVKETARELLRLERPVLSVLRNGQLLFDVRTLYEEDFSYIADMTATLIREKNA
jgi:L-seryl-tRNA(Ser) seleniumtransferase